ncbi:MAG: hypothetical protein WBG80_13140 [Bacteroidota bacterium]
MFPCRFIVFALLSLLFTSAYSQGITREEYLQGFRERGRFVTSYFDTTRDRSFASIMARYAHSVDVAGADSMFLGVLKEPAGDMFWMFPVLNIYMFGKENISPAAREAVRRAWKTYMPYRGDTENHWAMYYASLFIATEQWPGEPGSEWFNGKSSEENQEEAREYLIEWIRITTTIGQGEFDTPDYLPEYLSALLLLANFSQDLQMRKRGEMMMDYLLADFAVEHLEGQYLGGFSRVYQPGVYIPLKSGASAFAYLYFGTGRPVHSGWLVPAVLGTYRLPQIIYNIATDRSRPYVEKERKRVRNVIRFGKEKNPPVYKTTYVTKDYGLGSLHGGILQPIQQHTWGVRYTYGEPFTTIFGLHPYWSSLELGMFFPEELKPLIADVVSNKGTYNDPDKWTGSSPFERTYQHGNTLIVLYDIPPGTTTEHIDGFFPGNLEERIVDESGWILCKAGETYVGWYPLQESEWMEEKVTSGVEKLDIGVPADMARPGQTYWRLRSHRLQNGYVVEVRSRSEIGSFEKFSSELRNRLPDGGLKPGAVSVSYRTLGDDLMEFNFPEGRVLNGEPVDLDTGKLFDGPFLRADVGSQKLTMMYREKRRVLDFTTLTVTE